MPNQLLFWTPTFIWATTWHALIYQAGVVPTTLSIAYRFSLASVMFLVYALLKGQAIALPLRLHGRLAMAGTVQFGLNYWCTYEASKSITSGLLAVLFSLMVFSNAIAGSVFFSQSLSRRFLGSCLLGVLGVALIFWPDLAHSQASGQAWTGVALGLVAVLFATTGNILTLRITEGKIALVPVLGWSMAYGALVLWLISWASGQALVFDWRPSYIGSLLYLSLIGSFVAFLMYFKLAQRQGASKAGLIALVIPVIALCISAALEGWRPTAVSGTGAIFCLLGLWGATHNAPKQVTA